MSGDTGRLLQVLVEADGRMAASEVHRRRVRVEIVHAAVEAGLVVYDDLTDDLALTDAGRKCYTEGAR